MRTESLNKHAVVTEVEGREVAGKGIKEKPTKSSICHFVPAVRQQLARMAFEVKVSQENNSGSAVVLVDSGAQANLISRERVTTSNFTSRRGSPMKIKTADRTVSTTRQRVLFTIKREGYCRKIEFLVADIVQDFILGTPWLAEVEICKLQPLQGVLGFQKGSEYYSWSTVCREINQRTEKSV